MNRRTKIVTLHVVLVCLWASTGAFAVDYHGPRSNCATSVQHTVFEAQRQNSKYSTFSPLPKGESPSATEVRLLKSIFGNTLRRIKLATAKCMVLSLGADISSGSVVMRGNQDVELKVQVKEIDLDDDRKKEILLVARRQLNSESIPEKLRVFGKLDGNLNRIIAETPSSEPGYEWPQLGHPPPYVLLYWDDAKLVRLLRHANQATNYPDLLLSDGARCWLSSWGFYEGGGTFGYSDAKIPLPCATNNRGLEQFLNRLVLKIFGPQPSERQKLALAAIRQIGIGLDAEDNLIDAEWSNVNVAFQYVKLTSQARLGLWVSLPELKSESADTSGRLFLFEASPRGASALLSASGTSAEHMISMPDGDELLLTRGKECFAYRVVDRARLTSPHHSSPPTVLGYRLVENIEEIGQFDCQLSRQQYDDQRRSRRR